MTAFLAVLRQHEYEGTILFDGKDLRGIGRKRLYREAGIVFQNAEEEVIAGLRVWHSDYSDEKLKEEARIPSYSWHGK